jgi:hypothetical protein
MQELRDRARLVDASEIDGREIRATVPRTEIEGALKSTDGKPELVIDVVRSGDVEAHTLRLEWEPSELKELLRQAEGETATFAFGESELEQAIDDDVEAHGLRQRALVLAVAATTAAAGAGIAQAATTPSGHPLVSEREWPELVSQSGSASPAAISEREWPEVVGGAAAESAAPATAPATRPGAVSEREWPEVVSPSTSASPAPVSEREWPEVVGGTAAQSAAPTSARAPSGTSSMSDAETAAAVAGGVALLISAAAFTVRRRRSVEPRPT